jgi:hypothetical protein
MARPALSVQRDKKVTSIAGSAPLVSTLAVVFCAARDR